MDFKFASRGVANAGLTTGIIGTALGALNSLGGIAGAAIPASCAGACGAPTPFTTQYDAGLSARIAELETEVKLRDANIFTDQKILDVYKYFDGELKDVRKELCNQAVINERTAGAFKAVEQDIICTRNELYASIARERDERCCADNAIVTYVNNTFYPKEVVAVTVDATSTAAQPLYNPLPRSGGCGCGCGNVSYRTVGSNPTQA